MHHHDDVIVFVRCRYLKNDPSGVLELEHIAQICVPEKEDEDGRRVDIYIVDDERVFELRAANVADRQRWMQLLNANRKAFRRAMHTDDDAKKGTKFWKVQKEDGAGVAAAAEPVEDSTVIDPALEAMVDNRVRTPPHPLVICLNYLQEHDEKKIAAFNLLKYPMSNLYASLLSASYSSQFPHLRFFMCLHPHFSGFPSNRQNLQVGTAPSPSRRPPSTMSTRRG